MASKRNLNKEHILVLRLSAMGDVAMTVPVLLAFTKKHPQVKITVVTRAFFSPFFSDIPNVTVLDADVYGEYSGLFGVWKLFLKLRKLKFSAVADLHDVIRTKLLRFFFWIGFTSVKKIDKGRVEKNALTSLVNKTFKQLKTTHERYADVFRSLGYELELSTEDVLKRSTLLKQESEKEFTAIGIAPFAAFSSKQYPISLMEEVVKKLAQQKQTQLYLFGGGIKEKQQLDHWVQKYPNCVNMVQKGSFKEELQYIQKLNVMVAMDSGNAHMAAMYGVPTVTVWGETHPFAGFAPFAQSEHCLLPDLEKYPLIPTSVYGNISQEGYKDVMTTIAPEQLLLKIQKIIQLPKS